MQILGTRVATYGAIIMPLAFVVLYLFDALILKHQKLDKIVLVFSIVCMAIFYFILPYTPAIQNQKVDAINDLALLENGVADEGRERMKDGEKI